MSRSSTLGSLLKRVSCAVALVCLLGPREPAHGEAEPGGLVVEEVGAGTALERGGLLVGDVVTHWKTLVHSPRAAEAPRVEVGSWFDWKRLVIDEAPRASVQLSVVRQGTALDLEMSRGLWQAKLRPRIPEAHQEVYFEGKRLIAADRHEEGISAWAAMAATDDFTDDWRLHSWLLYRIGEAWAKAREWQKAQAAYQSALDEAPDARSKAILLDLRADVFLTAQDFDQAREACAAALSLLEEAGVEGLPIGRVFDCHGRVGWRSRQLDEYERYSRLALEIQQRLAPDSIEVAGNLNNLGIVAGMRGDLDSAWDLFGRALKISEELAPGTLHLARSLTNLSQVATDRSDLQAADAYLLRALEIVEELDPESQYVALITNNLGNVAWWRGYLDEAATYYQKALEIRRKRVPGSIDVSSSLVSLGIVAFTKSDLAAAMDYFQAALKIQEELAPDSLEVAATLDHIGSVAAARLDFEQAMDYHRRSLAIRQQVAPNSPAVSLSYTSLGLVAEKRDDLDAADEFFRKALEIQERVAPGGLISAGTLNNLGFIAGRRLNYAKAIELHKRSLGIVERLAPGSQAAARSFHNLGTAFLEQGQLVQAVEYFQRALDIREPLGLGSLEEAETLHSMGTALVRQGKRDLAKDFFGRALTALERQLGKLGGRDEVRAAFQARYQQFYRDAIDLFVDEQQPGEAFNILERSRARRLLEMLAERDLIYSADVPEELEKERRRVAVRYDMVQEELTDVSPSEEPEKLAALQRQLRELRQTAERVSQEIRQTSPRLAALKYPQPLELQQVRSILDGGTLLLAYSVGSKRTRIFALDSSGLLGVETVEVGEESLRAQIELLPELMKSATVVAGYDNGDRKQLERLSRHLYDLLIAPIDRLVGARDRLVIVPDGPLHVLPFGMLRREGGKGYLVGWKPIHVVVSATVYAELRKARRDGGESSRKGATRLTAFGDPRFPPSLANVGAGGIDEAQVRSLIERGFRLEPVPHTRLEVERIAALFEPQGVRVYLGEEATEARAKAVGRDVRVVHFATHGTIDDGFPLDSALALSIPDEFRAGEDNGLLQAWEVFERVRLDADLVVLSACESGLGGELDGEGLIGLTRAFQYAGARSVVASLWKVSDEVTAELMVRFYQHMEAGKSKDEALREAQLDLIRGATQATSADGTSVDKDTSAPYYWAAFQLFGDWR